MDDDMSNWSLDKLRRERDQAWELAGRARANGDLNEERRWTEEARVIAKEIGVRVRLTCAIFRPETIHERSH